MNQMTASWQESDDKPRQCVEKQRHYSVNKGPYPEGHGLPSGHIQLWELDHKEGRTPKNWCLQTVVLEKTPESCLESKKIKQVNLKRDQPWIFTGRTDTEAPVFWPSDVNIKFIGKVTDAGKDQGKKEKRALEDEMVGWHHWFNEHELVCPSLGKTTRDGEEQGCLPCCSPWGCKESGTTGQLINNSNNNKFWWMENNFATRLTIIHWRQCLRFPYNAYQNLNYLKGN